MKVQFAKDESGSLKLKDGSPYLVQVDDAGAVVTEIGSIDINDLYERAKRTDADSRKAKKTSDASGARLAKIVAELELDSESSEEDILNAIRSQRKGADPAEPKQVSESELAKIREKIQKDFADANKRERQKWESEMSSLRGQMDGILKGAEFAKSEYFNGTDKAKSVMPSDVARVYLDKFVETREGQVVVVVGGEPVMSQTRIGQFATLDEAMPSVIEQLPEPVRNSLFPKKEAKQAAGKSSQSNRIDARQSAGTKAMTKSDLRKDISLMTEFIEANGREAYESLPN